MAVNAEQAEDWNGASGRHFIEQRERWERMRGRLTARLLASAQIQADELTRQVRDRLVAYASPGGATMPGAAWLVTAQAV